MRVTNKSTNKKWKKPLLVGTVLLVAGIGIACYAISQSAPSNQDSNSSDVSGQASASKESNSTNSASSSEDATNSASSSSTEAVKTPVQYEGEDPDTSNSLTGVVNYKALSSSTLSIRITIDQTISSGVCTLSLTNNSKTVTKTADIVANPSSATCKGFDVPASELSSGTWAIKVNVIGDSKSGIIEDSVTI